jgi:RHS repeat-associated protein
VIEERDGADAVVATYTYGDGYVDEVLTMDRAGSRYYFHGNRLSSVYAITNSSGAVVERYFYTPYGLPTTYDANYGSPQSSSRVGNPFTFTGRELDAETGLYHFRARTFDPAEGRFKQRDPLGYVDGFNLYEYVGSRPTWFVDPFGLEGNGHHWVPNAVRKLLPENSPARKYFEKFKTGPMPHIHSGGTLVDAAGVTWRHQDYTAAVSEMFQEYRTKCLKGKSLAKMTEQEAKAFGELVVHSKDKRIAGWIRAMHHTNFKALAKAYAEGKKISKNMYTTSMLRKFPGVFAVAAILTFAEMSQAGESSFVGCACATGFDMLKSAVWADEIQAVMDYIGTQLQEAGLEFFEEAHARRHYAGALRDAAGRGLDLSNQRFNQPVQRPAPEWRGRNNSAFYEQPGRFIGNVLWGLFGD